MIGQTDLNLPLTISIPVLGPEGQLIIGPQGAGSELP